ncbi:MAG: hypothetical protein H0U65_03785 [Rubrobacter sp.]|jgi:hypothetical protein|nr:hypothetical protein [Rubrobacter sp.]
MALIERLVDANRSFMRLPLWVRVWLVFILLPANAATFFMKGTPTGSWAARTSAFIAAVNGSVILIQRGWGKALAVPHLFAWVPLLVFAARRVGEPEASRSERAHAGILLVVNGISLVFDVADTWRWIKGERGVP